VSESWLTTLGILKAAGAVGLLVGIRVPLIGIAAAIGLVLFLSRPSLLTCAAGTTPSVWRSCSSCWPWPHWYFEWPRCERGVEYRGIWRRWRS
jgi:hypothetical protein